jgi:rod shape determining protein RodA
MSYLEYNVRTVPSGLRKVLYVNWPLVLVMTATAMVGFLMLYSVAGGNAGAWAEPQMKRFAVGVAGMFVIAFVPIWFWRNVSALAYIIALALLVLVELVGSVGMGAQRWLEVGPIRVQPSELMKVALVMVLAAYYDWLSIDKVSHPLWVLAPVALILVPTALVLAQPNLGTALMLVMGGAAVMFAAGVSWWYFSSVIVGVGALVFAVFESRGTSWQLIEDYQFRRIDTFLNPGADPLGAGYNITQAQIALGSGGLGGKGFMQGSQSRLNFLPEKHTDFIFTILAEEFGFIGTATLLGLFALVLFFCFASAVQTRERYSALVIYGVATTFFLFFAVNMSMVMGLIPVVGVPLPLVSYGGTSMIILMLAFGLVQSAHIHRPR